MTLLAKTSAAGIKKAASLIRGGGTVVFPTETVYGLGADALNSEAVANIFRIKKRPRFDPLIVHVSSIKQAQTLAHVGAVARTLMLRFWPGPLTLVLPKKPIVPDIVTAGLDTVALRMPSHPAALALIRSAGVPVAAPSANRFGRLSPTTALHARRQLKNGPDIILDAGRAHIGVESTVLAVKNGKFFLLRHGGLPQEELERITGPLKPVTTCADRPASPGQLTRHYSPAVPLRIIGKTAVTLKKGIKYGYLAFRSRPGVPVHRFEILSSSGDLKEAAANLFSHLHKLDLSGADLILAEKVPAEGLGRAIMDRLKRAAAKNSGLHRGRRAIRGAGRDRKRTS